MLASALPEITTPVLLGVIIATLQIVSMLRREMITKKQNGAGAMPDYIRKSIEKTYELAVKNFEMHSHPDDYGFGNRQCRVNDLEEHVKELTAAVTELVVEIRIERDSRERRTEPPR